MVFHMKTPLTVGTITFYLSYFDEYVLTFKRPEREKKRKKNTLATILLEESKVFLCFGLVLLFLEDSHISSLF